MTTIWPGRPYPLGATWDGQGVNFALFSENATAVDLCLFDSAGEETRVAMPEQTDNVWHVFIPGLRPGQRYGYRVHGAYEPEFGQRFNPHKLLVDPYAKALDGVEQWDDALFAYTIGDEYEDLTMDERDSAPFLPKGVVIDSSFDWGGDKLLNIPLHKSIIYELHVKGFTKSFPSLPEDVRGTYAGLAHPATIDYLKSLGVSAIELLPVHQRVDDRHLVEQGLVNYWGYNTLAYFAPDIRYACEANPGDQVREFKAMVKTLHAAGIEVILDVVYNHTAEGNHMGPTLSLKGADNMVYYRTEASQPRYYTDYTGCGNSFSMLHSRTLQLVMDSLRYWVVEMHVDGFRFDLAATLARGMHDEERLTTFFDIIHQDPVLSQVKLIAEPWDIGPGGYQVGNFPVLWAEWNGKYRDTVRSFWRGDTGGVAEIAYRLTGSSDLYQHNGRSPAASINFITAHDGFTLRDLVSYNEKHNQANGENNRDGERHNNSWNCGVEGETDDLEVQALRARQQRNMLATLLLSQGVPMLLAGDERNRTQSGNNNGYCQDNEVGWLNWQADPDGQALFEFAQKLIRLRMAHPVLHRRRFFQGRSIQGEHIRDLDWLRPDGQQMTEQEWNEAEFCTLGVRLNGSAIDEWDEQGRFISDDVLLLLLNADAAERAFTLPPTEGMHESWQTVLDTAQPDAAPPTEHQPGQPYSLAGRSLALLRQQA
ncbi:MAG: glycogen debranching protein GlgX [Roseiflexaceae bacterium]|nr:glycogen debranching protein GlgX [Roseiflexaceae bacterium]